MTFNHSDVIHIELSNCSVSKIVQRQKLESGFIHLICSALNKEPEPTIICSERVKINSFKLAVKSCLVHYLGMDFVL